MLLLFRLPGTSDLPIVVVVDCRCYIVAVAVAVSVVVVVTFIVWILLFAIKEMSIIFALVWYSSGC